MRGEGERGSTGSGREGMESGEVKRTREEQRSGEESNREWRGEERREVQRKGEEKDESPSSVGVPQYNISSVLRIARTIFGTPAAHVCLGVRGASEVSLALA